MADDGGGRMLFDIRGKRKNVIRVVYAVLALLMGTSLFFVVGPVNIAELLGNEEGDAIEIFEEQTERIEARLASEPNNPQILISLTRAQINEGNSRVEPAQPGELAEIPDEAKDDYEEALDTWNRYLEVEGGEPSAAVAGLVAGTFFRLAESDTSVRAAEEHVEQAASAARIAAEQAPSLGSLSTLAIYEYFNGNFAAGDKAAKEAAERAPSKTEAKGIEAQLAEFRKNAKEFEQRKKQLARVQEELGQGESSGNPFALPGSEGPGGG